MKSKSFRKRKYFFIIFLSFFPLIFIGVKIYHYFYNPLPPLILSPADDATVSEKKINLNQGAENVLFTELERNYAIQSLLKFEVPELPQTPKAVILNLTIADFDDASSSESGSLYNFSDNNWFEEKVTWDNKPAVDGKHAWKIADEKVSFGKSYHVNLTNYINRSGTYSLAIISNNMDAVFYNSKEANWGKPTLTIYFTSFKEKRNLAIYPYLKKTTPNSAIIAWATEKESENFLIYGESNNDLKNKIKPSLTYIVSKNQSQLETNLYLYEAILNNLSSQTKYFYKIKEGKSDLIPEKELQFTTPPEEIGKEPIMVGVIGDYGRETPEKIQNFFQLKDLKPNLIITTGDNAYPNGSFSIWKNNIFSYLNESLISRVVFYPAVGNHDLDTLIPRENYDGRISPYEIFFGQPENPRVLYRSFDYGPAHFIILDSNNFESEKMLSWFKEDLESSQKSGKWNIVVWHHPNYSCLPTREADKEIEKLASTYIKTLTEKGGGILLHGHHHFYCRSKKITVINDPDLSSQKIDDLVSHSLKRNDNNLFSFSPGNIISYVTGGGSDELSKINTDLWPTETGREEFHILKMVIDNCQIKTSGITNKGEEFDQTIIEKCVSENE